MYMCACTHACTWQHTALLNDQLRGVRSRSHAGTRNDQAATRSTVGGTYTSPWAPARSTLRLPRAEAPPLSCALRVCRPLLVSPRSRLNPRRTSPSRRNGAGQTPCARWYARTGAGGTPASMVKGRLLVARRSERACSSPGSGVGAKAVTPPAPSSSTAAARRKRGMMYVTFGILKKKTKRPGSDAMLVDQSPKSKDERNPVMPLSSESADCPVPIDQPPRNKRCPKAKKQKKLYPEKIVTDREVTTVVTSKARGGNHADLLPPTLPSNFLASTFALSCSSTSCVYAFPLLV